LTLKDRAMNDEILTIKQVAGYLKVNERTIYRLAASAELPAFKVGNSWRFKRSDLEAWIKAQKGEKRGVGNDGDTPA
jgi:excisionase family DNA binding protein